MSNSKSRVLETQMIDHNFGGASMPQATQWWLALYSSNPTDTLTSATATVTSLYRLTSPNSNPVWNRTLGEASNAFQIELPAVPVSQTWNVSHFAIFDSSTNGRPLYFGPFAISKTLNQQEIFIIPVGKLVIKEQ